METELVFTDSTIIGYALSGSVAFLLPTGMFIAAKYKMYARIIPLIIGVFSYSFISVVRAVVRSAVINEDMARHMIFGFFVLSVISGVLEEVGRYAVFRWAIPNYYRVEDAFSYGIGHGGIEIAFTTGIVSFGDMFDAMKINRVGLENFIAENSGNAAEITEWVAAEYDSGMGLCFFGALMCLCGMVTHISLSVIVMAAVHYDDSRKLLLAAVGLHTASNFIAHISNMVVVGIFYTDLICAAVLCFIAYKVYKKYRMEEVC
ncbi:MAG: YhfC family intramembrane metalloprotease [Oscillospiraceae bacterium]|nr:YhfC family intramembrane metalloprotease [Oscillospiraceae bacterium]